MSPLERSLEREDDANFDALWKSEGRIVEFISMEAKFYYVLSRFRTAKEGDGEV